MIILRKGMSNPASSSSHCICTCCLAEFAVLVNVLMNLRQETWNEEPLQLFSIPAMTVRPSRSIRLISHYLTYQKLEPHGLTKFEP